MLPFRGIWEIYCYLFTLIVTVKAVYFFWPASPVYTYYHTLIGLHSVYTFSYALAFAQNIFSLFFLMPLFRAAYNRPFFNPTILKVLLPFRLAFDLFGNTYYWHFVQSRTHDNPLLLQVLIFEILVLYLPSYIALYLYAFYHERWFGDTSS